MKRFISTLIVMAIYIVSFSQDYNPNRYRESIFSTILTIPDVKYGEAPQWVWPYWDVDLNLDIYLPSDDTNPKRPVIIFAHAGGFINGSKEVDNMVAICDSFARKGFVTASIYYRKGFDPLDDESAERAVYRAVQDGKAAIRYFKEYADVYDIDTNNVFFGGMSAGGFIALNVGYMDKEEERPESTYGGGTVNDLKCLDCAGNEFEHSSSVKAILDYWGALGDTLLIEEGDTPILIMHGENDPVVPFIYDHPFGLFTLPETYGGLPISERVENKGIHYKFFTSEGDLHMLDGSDNGTFSEEGPNSFWSDTLLPETTLFLYELLKPNTIKISEDTTEICYGDDLVLQVSDSITSHYIWFYDDVLVDLVADDNSGQIELEFNSTGFHTITVVEFNTILCPGDTLTFVVNVSSEITADFSQTITDINTVDFANESTGGVSYEWNFGDDNSSTDTSPSHIYSENGTYDIMLIVTNEDGCTDTIINTISIVGLSILTNSVEQTIIYPNPFNNTLIIETNQINGNVSIMETTGKVIFNSTINSENSIQLNTENWAKGIYFVRFENENGELQSEKIIKQ